MRDELRTGAAESCCRAPDPQPGPSRRLYEQIEWARTYTDVIASTLLNGARLPVAMPDEREALRQAVFACNRLNPRPPPSPASATRCRSRRSPCPRPSGRWREVQRTPDLEGLSGPEPQRLDAKGHLAGRG